MVPRRPVRPPRRRRTPDARWWRGRRLTAYGREAISVLVLVGTLFLRDRPALPVAKREEERPPDIWTVDMRGPEAWWGYSAAARKVPSKPFPGQKTPPCTPRAERELSGGCWSPHLEKPPCPAGFFEAQEMCLTPVQATARIPTSLGE